MRRALEEYRIAGVTTTLRLYRALLDSTRFQGGQFHTGFVEEKLWGATDNGGVAAAGSWEADAHQRRAAALSAVLVDHQRSQGDESEAGEASRWRMLGRWELMRRWG
jgi:acetyl/propionyl-CoA carboxylase alpha subunit